MNYNQLKAHLKDYEHSILGAKTALHSSVMVPIVEVDQELHLLFEIRSHKLNSQPGEVSFPGGKIDPTDENPLAAAKREVFEELGLEDDQIDIFTELDLLVAPFGVIIHNFLGKINDISKIKLNDDEVHRVFTVPIQFFKETEPITVKNQILFERDMDFPFHLIPNGENYKFKTTTSETLFWVYEGITIWGLTASIIKNLIDLME